MFPFIAIAAGQFIVLQTLDGRDVYVNSEQIVSIAEPKPGGGSGFPAAVNCIVSLTDGKFATVAETCDSVRKRLNDLRRE